MSIRELIKELSREKTVILSTHIMQEAQHLSDKIVIINKGKIVAEGTPEELEKLARGEMVVHVITRDKRFKDILENKGFMVVESKEVNNEYEFVVTAQGKDDIREEIFNLARKEKTTLLEMWKERVSLEEVFLKLTKEEEA